MTSRIRSLAKRLQQTSIAQRLVAVIIIAATVTGLTLVGQGVYIKAKAVFAQVLLESAWSRALAGEVAPKAWPWADTWPVAKLNLPRIEKKTIVLNNASGEAMAFGPGLVAGTPLPGQPGTSVIAGHRDTHFEFLKDVKLGDSIEVVTRTNKRITYTVDYMEVVDASASGIEPNAPGESLALVTCWPFGDPNPGPLRYVVHAVPSAPSTATLVPELSRSATLSGALISLTR
jgi:sortase A